MSARDNILRKLRSARPTFDEPASEPTRRHMVPVPDTSREVLQALFVQQTKSLGCQVAVVANAEAALSYLLDLIGSDQTVLGWDPAYIPLPGLGEALAHASIQIVQQGEDVRLGLTGVDAALAGTGSLVLAAGAGKPRQPSIVPPVHVTILTADQIVPNFDVWVETQQAAGLDGFQAPSSMLLVSGPSSTGDIANIPVRGVHGPGTVHIILLPGASPAPLNPSGSRR